MAGRGEGGGRVDALARLEGLVNPRQGLLDHVLGIADAAEHPVGDGERPRAQALQELAVQRRHCQVAGPATRSLPTLLVAKGHRGGKPLLDATSGRRDDLQHLCRVDPLAKPEQRRARRDVSFSQVPVGVHAQDQV